MNIPNIPMIPRVDFDAFIRSSIVEEVDGQCAPSLATLSSRTYDKCDIKLIPSRQDRPLHRRRMYSCHDATGSRIINYV